MNTTLNISIDWAALEMVTTLLNDDELASLMRALVACVSGKDAEPMLKTSGQRIAFALLSPPIVSSVKRVATLRANGAKGGRPRKHPVEPAETQNLTSPAGKNQEETIKKSKKEDLSPTPPIEEKNKKNNNITLSPITREEEKRGSAKVILSHEELQRQMLNEQPWLDELCMSRHISRHDMERYIADFIKFLRERDLCETLPHAKAHFVNQLPYIIKIFTNNTNHPSYHENNQRYIADPVARRQAEREARRQEVCRAIAELEAASQQPAVIPF